VIGGASDRTDSDRMETVEVESWSIAHKQCFFIAEEFIEVFFSSFFCFILAFLNHHEKKKTVSAQISKYHKCHNPTEYDRLLKFT